MSNGLHLQPDKKKIQGSTYSQGVLTLQKAGKFTVHIKEYLDLLSQKSKLDLTRSRTLADSTVEKEWAHINKQLSRFDTIKWVWTTVNNSQKPDTGQNLFVKEGIGFAGKTFDFPKVLEGGGFCYVEAFFSGESATGIRANGLLVQAIGTPRILRVEWTDRNCKPIKDTKVAYGSHLLLHIYTEGLYGQEIMLGLSDANRQDTRLKMAGDDFFEVEVKSYPVQPFEENSHGISGLLGKPDKPTQAGTNIQKAIVEVAVDFSWMMSPAKGGSFVNDMHITADVIQKNTRAALSVSGDGNRLRVSTKDSKRMDYDQDTTNKPVVVGEIDTVAKLPKKPIDFTFGVFLDGTLNNMYNTELRQLAEGKKPLNTTGLAMSQPEASKIYKPLEKKDNSYENDLSNPAILFKNYSKDPQNKIFKVYTEGIGTNSSPAMQEATNANPNPVRNTSLTKEDYKKDDKMLGPAFGMASAGIMNRVKKSIEDVVSIIKEQDIDEDHCVGTITFDVFGFSRGAAAARHFVHLVTHGPYLPKKGMIYPLEDLQNNNLPFSYNGKLMPKYGPLGQLLTEAELMDEVLTKVNVRFVGIYDTVPHHGLFQWNDIKDLGLDNVNRADYVVHMVAADEHRANFSLVDISTVAKVSPESKKKGGIELMYPGVHCDVGGAYEEGRIDNPLRIDAATSEEALVPLRNELMQQGWFKDSELTIILNPLLKLSSGVNRYRLEGKRKLSNQYSYIPLHHMAEFCTKKQMPISEAGISDDYKFYNNFIDDIPDIKYKNVAFLEDMKIKLWDYTFGNSKPVTFGSFPKEVSFLRNHYLHWNSTYGEEGIEVGVQTNYPRKEDGKRQRKVR
ncbi:DUF2235 domain-containing protein [Epilithonimonas ginsengisoli]|uniref:DUF2235 domain-containing protein n=1 Tax=Epilithonimonas ginsengisoli TaxID=1245592 RepID=A0ABU4JND8_9FLAO|nr:MULTISPECIES: DUF2235 domain-containing protein [Chryseobacterium group]MBV6880302.1 DUF2235 domain-containing protein [Epilithonimonas sp. FP105]MDW8551079.1 DUF2235 domain-containing protein [Epilithonimonas ginsengisoli]OAH65388.1 hypothetical protein AXA65_18315 [Chryseobacterium sp. FP211-J200]